MKSIKLAFTLFGLGYLIATIVGFSTYYIHITVMWIAIFTLMPVVFGYLFYLYLRKTKCERFESFKQTSYLILFWIILSFLLDAVIILGYISRFFYLRSLKNEQTI